MVKVFNMKEQQMQKLKAQHLKSFNEALVTAESLAKDRTANICFYAGSNRIEMNRMIASNNEECAKFNAAYAKFYDHFEAQFLDDVDIEPFTAEDIQVIEHLFEIKIDNMNKATMDLKRFSNDNMVAFSIATAVNHISFVFKDIVDIIKEHYMIKK